MNWAKNILSWIVVIILVGAYPGYLMVYYQTDTFIEVTIIDKERIQDGDESKYIIFTDKETLQNTDMHLIGKYNSSDIYAKLLPDSTYRLEVYGWRMPVFSKYRNIAKIIE